ncbi:MAG: hypothetical protein K2X72_33665 [Reyranella sp.]|nr:hypothetical protein [Reyranella sp.]
MTRFFETLVIGAAGQIDSTAVAAMAQCNSKPAAGIPVLEKHLKDGKVALPTRSQAQAPNGISKRGGCDEIMFPERHRHPPRKWM